MVFDFKKEYKEFYMPKMKPQIVNVPRANYIAVRGVGDPNEEGGDYKNAIGLLYTLAFTLKMSRRTGHEIEGFFDYVVPPLEGFWWQPGSSRNQPETEPGSSRNQPETEPGRSSQDQPGTEPGRSSQDQPGTRLAESGKNTSSALDYTRKSDFHWISVIRLPDFIKKEDFEWAVEEAGRKKKMDCSQVEFLTIEEGLCVQIMHIGSYDDEPASIALMDAYLKQEGYVNDLSEMERQDRSADDFTLIEDGKLVPRLHHEIYLSDARKVEPARRRTVIRHPIRKM